MLLSIKNLHASINGKEILKGINLEVNKGEVHAIMGPNGTGKSTLASVIAGREVSSFRLKNAPGKGFSWDSSILWKSPVSASPTLCVLL
jgi:ABC-type molybdenum transport system ATPase subunit/photorepair protein PhrA